MSLCSECLTIPCNCDWATFQSCGLLEAEYIGVSCVPNSCGGSKTPLLSNYSVYFLYTLAPVSPPDVSPTFGILLTLVSQLWKLCTVVFYTQGRVMPITTTSDLHTECLCLSQLNTHINKGTHRGMTLG